MVLEFCDTSRRLSPPHSRSRRYRVRTHRTPDSGRSDGSPCHHRSYSLLCISLNGCSTRRTICTHRCSPGRPYDCRCRSSTRSPDRTDCLLFSLTCICETCGPPRNRPYICSRHRHRSAGSSHGFGSLCPNDRWNIDTSYLCNRTDSWVCTDTCGPHRAGLSSDPITQSLFSKQLSLIDMIFSLISLLSLMVKLTQKWIATDIRVSETKSKFRLIIELFMHT